MKKSTWAKICLVLALLALIGGFANDSLFNFDNLIPTLTMWALIVVLGCFGLANCDAGTKKDEKKEEENK